MDHHCPWMGAKCIGFRTYPSFLHFLASVTFLAAYISVVCIRGLVFAFSKPLVINEITPVHMLILSFAGCVFTLVMGSFLGYHIYLVLTNQTTLEHISPFHLLRHLPPLPPCRLSSPPQEHQLVFSQRRAVRRAHARLRLYDVGWRRNTAQVFGTSTTGPSPSSTKRRWFAAAWAARLVWGGNSCGTGTQFPWNPHAEDVLVELAAELVRLENNDRY
jgi:palmitoyltransferase